MNDFMNIATAFAIVIVYTLSLHAQVAAQPPSLDSETGRVHRIDGVIERHMQQNHIPGAVALILKDGEVAYEKAFGFSNIEDGKRMTVDTIFRIASQSKAITSVAAMILLEEGQFLLDEPVSKYLPAFKHPRVLDSYNVQTSKYSTVEARREILIRDLFRHTSGIAYPAVFSDPTMWKIYEDAGIPSGIGTTQSTLEKEMEHLAAMPLMQQPGEAFTYGLNIDLLGYLVEIWSGQPLNVFMRERVFEPLQMDDTWFYLPDDKHDRLVELYEINNNGDLVPVNHPIYDGTEKDFPKMKGTYFSGGAGLSSIANDLANFYTMYLNKGVFKGERILASSTVNLLLENQLEENVEVSPLSPQPANFRFSHGGFAIETGKNDYLSPRARGAFGWGGAFNTHGWADPHHGLIGILLTQEYLSPHYTIGREFRNAVYQFWVNCNPHFAWLLWRTIGNGWQHSKGRLNIETSRFCSPCGIQK